MATWLTLLLLMSVFVVGFQSHGNFQTYNNNPAREQYRVKNIEKLNDISSADEHWLGQLFPEPSSTFFKTLAYQPDWPSLDSRPLPTWFDQSKVGIFIHWGVFSVPGISDAWFWKHWKDGDESLKEFMAKNYKPGFTYQEFAPEFTAEFYDPVQWAKIFAKSGARYVVLTSKHHEGYTLWPSRNSFSWNAMDVGPHRDLVAELASAVRNNTSLKFGLYHSLYEWFNPLWVQDQRNNYTTDEFVRFKTLPELYDLVNTYRPEIIWSDGQWEALDTYWKSKEFLTWLYNDSPVKDMVVTNDRWGKNTVCKHGGYFTCADRYNPGILPPYKWENAMTLDKKSWGYRRNASIDEYLTPEELLTTLVETVACGGNILVNVGPTREGVIPVVQQERLEQMGEWLGINGDAIYKSIPYTMQNDTVTPGVWYTMSADASKIYGMMTRWPGARVSLGGIAPSKDLMVNMLGYKQTLDWVVRNDSGIVVSLPHQNEIQSKWVWTLVFSQKI